MGVECSSQLALYIQGCSGSCLRFERGSTRVESKPVTRAIAQEIVNTYAADPRSHLMLYTTRRSIITPSPSPRPSLSPPAARVLCPLPVDDQRRSVRPTSQRPCGRSTRPPPPQACRRGTVRRARQRDRAVVNIISQSNANLRIQDYTHPYRPIRPDSLIPRILQRPSRIPHNTVNRESRQAHTGNTLEHRPLHHDAPKVLDSRDMARLRLHQRPILVRAKRLSHCRRRSILSIGHGLRYHARFPRMKYPLIP